MPYFNSSLDIEIDNEPFPQKMSSGDTDKDNVKVHP